MLRKFYRGLPAIIAASIALAWILQPGVSMGQGQQEGAALRWWRMPEESEKLKLTEEEKERLDTISVASRLKLVESRADLEKARIELQALLEQEPLNERTAKEQFKKLEDARNALAAQRFAFLLEVRKILGVERFRQLESSYKELSSKNMMHGGHDHNREPDKTDAPKGDGKP